MMQASLAAQFDAMLTLSIQWISGQPQTVSHQSRLMDDDHVSTKVRSHHILFEDLPEGPTCSPPVPGKEMI